MNIHLEFNTLFTLSGRRIQTYFYFCWVGIAQSVERSCTAPEVPVSNLTNACSQVHGRDWLSCHTGGQRLAGVAPEVNLREHVTHTPLPSVILPTLASTPNKRGLYPLKIKTENSFVFSFTFGQCKRTLTVIIYAFSIMINLLDQIDSRNHKCYRKCHRHKQSRGGSRISCEGSWTLGVIILPKFGHKFKIKTHEVNKKWSKRGIRGAPASPRIGNIQS